MEQTTALRIYATDVSAQKEAYIADAPRDETVATLVASLIADLKLPRTDRDHQPITYALRHDGSGELLQSSSQLSEVLTPDADNKLTILPSIMAGGRER